MSKLKGAKHVITKLSSAGTLLNDDKLLEFSEIGCYCQLDLFGTEVSWYQLNPSADMPSDAQRVDRLKMLADHGKLERILVSHDIHTKHRLVDISGLTLNF